MSISTQWTVTGMTCQHCVAAVTEEVSSIAGVEAVEIDLGNGLVTVRSEADISVESMAAAVDEAGYTLAAN
ncbi:MAG: cation transporter [Actinomycetes bacterium]